MVHYGITVATCAKKIMVVNERQRLIDNSRDGGTENSWYYAARCAPTVAAIR